MAFETFLKMHLGERFSGQTARVTSRQEEKTVLGSLGWLGGVIMTSSRLKRPEFG